MASLVAASRQNCSSPAKHLACEGCDLDRRFACKRCYIRYYVTTSQVRNRPLRLHHCEEQASQREELELQLRAATQLPS